MNAIGYFRFLLLYFRAVMITISIVCIITTGSVASENGRLFGIDDYFKLNHILELSLSSDGRMIVYVVQSQSLEKNGAVNNVFLSTTGERAKPVIIEAIQDCQRFTWIPGKNEVAFLSDRDGVTQVYSFNIDDKRLRRLTASKGSISNYKFSHDGDKLAYITSGNPHLDRQADYTGQSVSLYEEIFHGNHGVVLNSDVTGLHHFVNPNRSRRGERPKTELWLKEGRREPEEIRIRGEIKEFYWAPDGEKLSLLYFEQQNATLSYSSYTSIGVFDLRTMEFRPLAHAKASSFTGGEGLTFAGGEWLHESEVHVRLIVEHNAWSSEGYWAILDLSRKNFAIADVDWKPSEYYIDTDDKIIKGESVYIEKTINGERALYSIEREELRRAEIILSIEGTVSRFQFSEDFKTAAFINESMTMPPEIFVWRDHSGVRQLTHLNEAISKRQLPRARRIVWNSRDGTTVHGWLLEPIDSSNGGEEPWPLVTFVHGGPGTPFRNEFAFYFSSGRWPYPFEVYALNGIAVLLPDYRGTKTYGNDFATPKKIDGESVDDIISGIDYLIGAGVADANRLGISGHSHGAWLAPLVMTRSHHRFQAGSFAEGPGNTIVAYDLMPGALNRITHDVQWGEGASLYADTQRYIELSPSLHFKRLKTATLFEAGAESAAIIMLGYQKAARFAGMPSVFVSYPKTAHNIVLPRLKYESATRNLDWFRFWLQGYEDPDPAKADQYARWSRLRSERCSNKDPERPRYCDGQEI